MQVVTLIFILESKSVMKSELIWRAQVFLENSEEDACPSFQP